MTKNLLIGKIIYTIFIGINKLKIIIIIIIIIK